MPFHNVVRSFVRNGESFPGTFLRIQKILLNHRRPGWKQNLLSSSVSLYCERSLSVRQKTYDSRLRFCDRFIDDRNPQILTDKAFYVHASYVGIVLSPKKVPDHGIAEVLDLIICCEFLHPNHLLCHAVTYQS